MKMPEPEIKEAKFGGYDAYTHAQMQKYGRDLLEAAAQKCDERANGENDAQHCADSIRSMKETL